MKKIKDVKWYQVLKNNIQKLASPCYKKHSISKKNSSVNLKNGFSDFEDLSYIFLNFKSKLDQLNKSSYTVEVSGGHDSLALVALVKADRKSVV